MAAKEFLMFTVLSLLLAGGTCYSNTQSEADEYCPSTGMKPYDYPQALCMSYLFYEAQRSGELPADQRVKWRGDSAMDDGSDVNHNLTGGYYDAGDHVKFGYPFAFATTMLAWGLIDYRDGQTYAGQTKYAIKTIKWSLDYMMKAHTGYRELYGQVANATVDHEYWGRPEQMSMERPAFKIDNEHPGAELAAETAAASAAGYIVFQHSEPKYADKCLQLAKEMFDFADEKRVSYSESIPQAKEFYTPVSGFGDDLAWASVWLYRATGNKTYLSKAREYINTYNLTKDVFEFGWDNKTPGFLALLANLTKLETDKDVVRQYLDNIRNYGPYTPAGLFFVYYWGSLRSAANVAFIALYGANLGLEPELNTQWAEKQINYMLGSTGHSFVVGFGKNPPVRPHHRSSSCPPMPKTCDWDQYFSKEPNPHVLHGGLVGGPDQDDSYADDREDYVHNEVSLDYNAGYTAALAAIVENNSKAKASQFVDSLKS